MTVVDRNSNGFNTMIDALGICRGNECTLETLNKALNAKPVPHMSVLEFGWVCIKVEGISVKTRIQVLRSRLFSTMERSTRSVDMTDAEVIIPETSNNKTDMFERMCNQVYRYSDSIEDGESIEDASYLLPMGVETSFFMAANLRVWFEYMQKRLCKKHVQDEHFRLAMEMWNTICELYPVMQKAHPCSVCGDCGKETRV